MPQGIYACPLCECKLKFDELSQHIKHEHKDQIDSMTTCKICKTQLKVRNTIKHLKNVHESSNDKHPKRKKMAAADTKIKTKTTTKATLEEKAQIQDYLRRNPL